MGGPASFPPEGVGRGREMKRMPPPGVGERACFVGGGIQEFVSPLSLARPSLRRRVRAQMLSLSTTRRLALVALALACAVASGAAADAALSGEEVREREKRMKTRSEGEGGEGHERGHARAAAPRESGPTPDKGEGWTCVPRQARMPPPHLESRRCWKTRGAEAPALSFFQARARPPDPPPALPPPPLSHPPTPPRLPPPSPPRPPPPLKALAELVALRHAAPDRVIPFDEATFARLASTPPGAAARPYTLAFFLTAAHMMDKPKLGLRGMRKEWGRLAGALVEAEGDRPQGGAGKAGGAPPIFMAALEFGGARDVFTRLGATSLPWVVTLRPGVAVAAEGGPLKLEAGDVMRHDTYGARHWGASDFGLFLRDRAPGGAAWVPRPPPPPSIAGPLSGVALLAAAAAAAKPAWRLYNSPLAANTALQAAAALAVWWFAVSAGLYNIIRGMPLVAPGGPGGRPRMFLDRGGQLGAEGFIMGTLYTAVGLAAAGLTHAVPRVSTPAGRRVAGFGVLAALWFAYSRVASLHAWKTGIAWRVFLF